MKSEARIRKGVPKLPHFSSEMKVSSGPCLSGLAAKFSVMEQLHQCYDSKMAGGRLNFAALSLKLPETSRNSEVALVFLQQSQALEAA